MWPIHDTEIYFPKLGLCRLETRTMPPDDSVEMADIGGTGEEVGDLEV